MSKTIGVILSLIDKCSPVLKKIGERFGMTENEAKKFARTGVKALKNVRATVLNVAKGFGTLTVGSVVLAKKISDAGDKIDKSSKKIGMSATGYQRWNFIMSQCGGSVDNLGGAIKTLRKNIDGYDNVTKKSIPTLRKLGINIRDNNGHLRNQEDIFDDSVKALQGITNETERAIIGQKLFGRGYQELAPLLNSGVGSLDRLKEQYRKLGIEISDDKIAQMVKFKDTMDKIQKTFEFIGMQLGSDLIPYMQQLADTVVKNMPQIKESLIPVVQTFSKGLVFAIKNLPVLIPLVTGYATALTVLKTGMDLYNISAAVCLATNPFGWVAVAIASVTTLIGLVNKFRRHEEEAFRQFRKHNQEEKGSKMLTFAERGREMTISAAPKKHALGTASAEGGTALVGEYGPELVDLPRGSKVTPANDTKQALAQSSSNVTINLNVQGNVLGNREFMNEMLNIMGVELRKVMPA